jgi:hypothetical protein
MTGARFIVRFLRASEGGRLSLAHLDKGGYSPHFRVSDDRLLGVRILPPPDGPFVAEVPASVSVQFLYETDGDYSALRTGSSIAIVEDTKVIGWATIQGDTRYRGHGFRSSGCKRAVTAWRRPGIQ